MYFYIFIKGMHQNRKKSKVDEFSIGNSGDESSIGNSGNKNPAERKRFAESHDKVYSVIIILLKQYFLTNNFINVLTSSTLY
jgi:hypothetical protein